jgi:hypothetical protein
VNFASFITLAQKKICGNVVPARLLDCLDRGIAYDAAQMDMSAETKSPKNLFSDTDAPVVRGSQTGCMVSNSCFHQGFCEVHKS